MKLGLKLHVCRKTANSSDVHAFVGGDTYSCKPHPLQKKEIGSGHAGVDPEIEGGRVYMECGLGRHPQRAVV